MNKLIILQMYLFPFATFWGLARSETRAMRGRSNVTEHTYQEFGAHDGKSNLRIWRIVLIVTIDY